MIGKLESFLLFVLYLECVFSRLFLDQMFLNGLLSWESSVFLVLVFDTARWLVADSKGLDETGVP